jgi:hypothetical protein
LSPQEVLFLAAQELSYPFVSSTNTESTKSNATTYKLKVNFLINRLKFHFQNGKNEKMVFRSFAFLSRG